MAFCMHISLLARLLSANSSSLVKCYKEHKQHLLYAVDCGMFMLTTWTYNYHFKQSPVIFHDWYLYIYISNNISHKHAVNWGITKGMQACIIELNGESKECSWLQMDIEFSQLHEHLSHPHSLHFTHTYTQTTHMHHIYIQARRWPLSLPQQMFQRSTAHQTPDSAWHSLWAAHG